MLTMYYLYFMIIKRLQLLEKHHGHFNENGQRESYILKNKEKIKDLNEIISDMYVEGLFGWVYTITEQEPVNIDGRNTNYTCSTFSIGDIVVVYDDDYQNDNFVVGEKNMYLYIGENNFITVKDENVVLLDDTASARLVDSLIGQNCFIVLRPSIAIDIVPMNLDVSYNNTNLTNKNVIVTVTSNEEIWMVDGWTISEDKKTLTKTYLENTFED